MASGPSQSVFRALEFVWTTSDAKGTPDADSCHGDLNHHALQDNRPQDPLGPPAAPPTAPGEQVASPDPRSLRRPPQGPTPVLDGPARPNGDRDRSEPAFKLGSGDSGPSVPRHFATRDARRPGF